MSGHANNLAKSMRDHETGLVWNEVLTASTGNVKIKQYSVVRVKALAACTVKMDGITSMTMALGEIEIFNAGPSINGSLDKTVLFNFNGNCNVQIGKEI